MSTPLIILSGGQSGVDAAALRAARALGIPTRGSMPRDFMTENGPRPEYAELYGMIALPSSSYPARTAKNVRDSDMTLWLGPTGSVGYRCTMKAVKARGEGYGVCRIANLGCDERSVKLAAMGVRTLLSDDPSHINVINVAGNRESSNPGISERAEAFLVELFTELLSR